MLTVKYRQYDKRPWCRQYYFTVTVGEGDTKQTGKCCEHLQVVNIYKLWTLISCEHLQVVNTYKLWTHKSYEHLKV
jgi:hypothetical protein